MEQFESLFKQVSLLVQQENDEIKARTLRGEQFNIFKVCGIDHYELQHSAIISELLNPQGSHGQGKLYLKLFMQVYGSKLPIDEIEYDKVRVRTEKWTEAYDGRMDICIEYDGLPFVIIENKLYAKDQSIQLRKYKEDSDTIIKKSQHPEQKYEIVYLTLDGKDATKDSGDGVDYIRMSYSKDIIKWLALSIESSARIPLVRETLVQYQNHIKQLTNQNMEQENKNALFELLTRYPKEAEYILNTSRDEYIQYLYENKVLPKLKDFVKENNLLYTEYGLWSGKAGKGFCFRKETWKRNAIWFYTDRQGLREFYEGISNYAGESIANQNKLECLNEPPISQWPYGYSWFKYDVWDGRVILDMINGEFANTIIGRVRTILEEVERKNLTKDW